MLAQAFPAAAGAFPVTPECAKSALEATYNPFEIQLLGLDVTGTITEPVPGRVVTSDHQYFVEHSPRDSTHTGTVTIDERGFLSSIETTSTFTDRLSGETFKAAAAVKYSDVGSELTSSMITPLDSTKKYIVEDANAGFARRIETELKRCGSDLISFNPSPYRFG